MRKTFLIAIIFLAFHETAYAMRVIDLSDGKIHSTADDSDDRPRRKVYESYSSNYQKGYKEGYTYSGGGIREIAPIPPIAPIPNVGETAEDAYTRGILDGQRKKQNKW